MKDEIERVVDIERNQEKGGEWRRKLERLCMKSGSRSWVKMGHHHDGYGSCSTALKSVGGSWVETRNNQDNHGRKCGVVLLGEGYKQDISG